MEVTRDPWLTTAEAAEHARCSPYTIRVAAEHGRLSGVKSSPAKQARWRFRTSDVDRWLEHGRQHVGPIRRGA